MFLFQEIIQRGQEYELLDTSNKTKWKVNFRLGYTFNRNYVLK